jgi:hypothetical protein
VWRRGRVSGGGVRVHMEARALNVGAKSETCALFFVQMESNIEPMIMIMIKYQYQ